MSGLPEQSEEKWEESLRTIAELSPEHISAYSLIVEPGTPFAEQKLDLPDEDTEREMYARTAEILAEYRGIVIRKPPVDEHGRSIFVSESVRSTGKDP